jgi:hypothetical protein
LHLLVAIDWERCEELPDNIQIDRREHDDMCATLKAIDLASTDNVDSCIVEVDIVVCQRGVNVRPFTQSAI